VNAVTTDAGRHARFVFLLQEFSVDAGVILAFLVDTKRRIESLHQVRVAMAFAAISRNVESLWLSQKTFGRVLRSFFSVGVGIAAVTIIARQTARFVNVIVEEFRRSAQTCVFKLDMTIDAGTLFLSMGYCAHH
jgi:hypothetical protein